MFPQELLNDFNDDLLAQESHNKDQSSQWKRPEDP